MATPEVAPRPEEVYAVFCGGIDQAAVARIINAVSIASQRNVPRVHILFQSAGGMIGEGICLYNFFRESPVPITLYNVGGVMSIATIAYLGADQRKVSA